MTFLHESIPYLEARTLFEKKKDEVERMALANGFELINTSVRDAHDRALARLENGYHLERQGNLSMACRYYDEAKDLLWDYLAEVNRMYAAVWITGSRELLEQTRPSSERIVLANLHREARERYRVGKSVRRVRPRDSIAHYQEARDIGRSVYNQLLEIKPILSEGAARFILMVLVFTLLALFIIAMFLQ